MSAAKGGHVLKRHPFLSRWVHKDVQPADGHEADPHYIGEIVWRCYDCHEKIIPIARAP